MLKNTPAMLAAFSMATVATAISNEAHAQENGIHQWSEPSQAEFVVEDVRTKFLFPSRHYRDQDVHIDCALMIRGQDPDTGADKPIVPVGFIAQFNAETGATIAGLAPGALKILENYKGSLDYRKSSQQGVLRHMSSQHEIDMEQVGKAGQRCWSDYRDQTTNIGDLKFHGSIHNAYD